jgi:hypothetical protein
MSWKEYPSHSDEKFGFAVLRMVDLDAFELNMGKLCKDLEKPDDNPWALEYKFQNLRQKYRDDVTSPVFDVPILESDGGPQDWWEYSQIAFGILRQVRMDTYDFDQLARAHDEVSKEGRDALEQRFVEFGAKYMDGTHYEKNSSGARKVDAAERARLREITKDDSKFLVDMLGRIRTEHSDSDSSIVILYRSLARAHEKREADLQEIYNPNIRYTLRDIMKEKSYFLGDRPQIFEYSAGTSPKRAKSWIKDYVDHIHKLLEIYENMTLKKVQ